MMYRNSQKVHMNVRNTRMQCRALFFACAALLVAVVVLAVNLAGNSGYRDRAEEQFRQHMLDAVSSAVEEVNRMSAMVSSDASSRLSRVRQYVYYMERLNELSMSLAGGENGRLAPAEAFTYLNGDLKAFEDVIAQAKVSTLDVRTTLLNRLLTLQNFLNGM